MPTDVVDFRAEDFTRRGPYDAVLDLVAHRSVFAYRRALARGGRYRCVGGTVRALLRVVPAGRLTGRSLGVLVVRTGPAHSTRLADVCLAGEVAVRIDRTYGLDDVAEALARVGAGRALGKVVVTPG
ncbi:zinc-binding dehydrogenase [Blastococcus sp. SYSU D00669]